jgi:hypothetical protein
VVRLGKYEVEDIDSKSKVEVAQSGKVEEVNQKEVGMRVCGNRMKANWYLTWYLIVTQS